MSLINQMLKDLASREKGVESSHTSAHLHGQAVLSRLTKLSFSKESLNKKVFLASLFFCFSAGVLAYYKHVPLLRMMPPLTSQAPIHQNAEITNSNIPALANMSEGTIIELDKEIDIRIPFDKLPLYRIDAYPDLQRISIYFDRTRIPNNFQPRIHPEGGLTGMNYLQMGQDARLDLDIGTELQLKQVTQVGQMVEIQFSKIKNQDAKEADITEQTKQPVKQMTKLGAVQIKYDEAVEKIQGGDQIGAQQTLFSIVESMPDYLPARVALIALTLSMDQEPSATRLLERGLEIAPHHPDLISLKAGIFLRHQKTDAAIQLLTQESPDFSKYPDYYAQLASAYLQKNRYQEAFKIYRSLNQRAEFVKPAWREGLQIAMNNLGKNAINSEEVTA